MRIAYSDDCIWEIKSISASPCWHSESETYSISNPEHYFVSICTNEDGNEEIGEYLLDGTEKTYKKAQKNFKKICKKILTKGYCTMKDFKNFEI